MNRLEAAFKNLRAQKRKAFIPFVMGGDPNLLTTREILPALQEAGADIITCTPELLSKLHLLGKPLAEYSLDTVKMFYDDACKAGYTL